MSILFRWCPKMPAAEMWRGMMVLVITNHRRWVLMVIGMW